MWVYLWEILALKLRHSTVGQKVLIQGGKVPSMPCYILFLDSPIFPPTGFCVKNKDGISKQYEKQKATSPPQSNGDSQQIFSGIWDFFCIPRFHIDSYLDLCQKTKD